MFSCDSCFGTLVAGVLGIYILMRVFGQYIGVLADKFMFWIIGKTFLYNVSWEDPRIDRRVMHLSSADHVLTIASAGCNSFDYLIEGAKVTAVDLNRNQISLTELKAVAAAHLEFEDFFKMFAESDMEVFKDRYYNTLRPLLSPETQEFWDYNVTRINNLMYAGASGILAYLIFRVFFPLFGLGFIRQMLVDGVERSEFQKQVQKRYWRVECMNFLADTIAPLMAPLAGVPSSQLSLGDHRNGNMAAVMKHVLLGTDMKEDNYFFFGYLTGYYTKTNCPRYLQERHFLKLKEAIKAERLNLVHGTLVDAARAAKTREFTVASLLDHMDWMPPKMIIEELSEVLPKMDPQQGRVFWRSYSENVHSAPLAWIKADRVNDHDDRVGMYWSTWIGRLDSVPQTITERCSTWDRKEFLNQGVLSKLITGAKMVTFPAWQYILPTKGEGQYQKMEAFYKLQKEGYDAFREGLLHARPLLIDALHFNKQNEETKGKSQKLTWIDVGGGTARNLEYVPAKILRENFEKIVIVDVSESLLGVAKERVHAAGLDGLVDFVLHDFTDESVFKKLPTKNTVDILTMSYSLSMIPDKSKALKNALALLKPNGEGTLGLADFWQNPSVDGTEDSYGPGKWETKGKTYTYEYMGNQTSVGSKGMSTPFLRAENNFLKSYFAQDHVFLLHNDLKEYGFKEKMHTVWKQKFRGAVPFLPMLRPYHGVHVMRTPLKAE